MKDERPFAFEVDRGDGERLKVLYTPDCFYQLQESLNEPSVFVGKSIMKGKIKLLISLEARVYLITEIDPVFFLLRAVMPAQG